MQVKGLRAQADKLNEMAKMNEIILEKERLEHWHAKSLLEQQASYTRIGKPQKPARDEVDCVSHPGSSVVNHEAKRAISNTMTWMDQIDDEVKTSFLPLGLTSFTKFRLFRNLKSLLSWSRA